MSEPKLMIIALSDIRENPVALRGVNKQTEAYLGLVDSIRARGIINAISVREMVDPETQKTFYSLIDGLHRFTASMDAGKKDIPAQVMSMSDADVMEAQIIGNIHKIETRPVEYSDQLRRILVGNPLMTLTMLANKLNKTSQWLNERLGLLKLDKQIAALVDEGKINLSNAYALAKLPEPEQAGYVDRAMTMSPAEFTPTVLARKKELDTAKRQGRPAGPAQFTPVAIIRRKSEIQDEIEKPTKLPALIRSAGITSMDAAVAFALSWTLQLDPASVELQKAADEKRKAEMKAKKDKAKAERDDKERSEAASVAVSVSH